MAGDAVRKSVVVEYRPGPRIGIVAVRALTLVVLRWPVLGVARVAIGDALVVEVSA